MSIIETHNCKVCPCFIYKTCNNCPEHNLFGDCDARSSWENRCTVYDRITANEEEKKENQCKYYKEPGECLHMNDESEPGECIYGDGIIKENAAIHCSQG